MTEEALLRQLLNVSAAERAAILVKLCGGQPELRAAVEARLAAQAAPAGLPVSPPTVRESIGIPDQQPDAGVTSDFAAFDAAAGHLASAHPGLLIAGRYVLEKRLGEGGMGEVWVAQQTLPVKRNVALKLIKSGMESKGVLARFELERQALAVMDHPHIAKVFDAGLTPLGQPFFAMELVDGLSLTKFCDEAKLTPKQRLELFVPICQAVQHAHQKGVVHRDLKPANILVALVDGRPTPKVIDFGVAKATAGKLTDEPMTTQFGAVVGTLEYMAPEQAGTTGDDVDTRADVYSLGVVLYELLTGLRPIDAKRLRHAALTEMVRIIREEEPSAPSTRLSTDEALPSLAALRQTEPRKLMAMLRGELDWVVMKCLEKQRDRRYETASALARDVQRYLADEVVEARPPSRGYRLRKFMRRHRGQVIAASAVAAALVAGIVGTSVGMWHANRERATAESATRQAFLALQSFTDEFVERQFTGKTILTDNDRAILRKAMVQWEAFASTRGESQQARDIRAEGLFRVAALRQRLGENVDAEAGLRAALALLIPLVKEFPQEAHYAQRASSAHVRLGTLLWIALRHDEALAEFDLALAAMGRLVAADPANREYRTSEANAWNARGVVLRAAGKKEEAHEAYARARQIQADIVAAWPEDAAARLALATSHNNQGNISLTDGDLQAAESHYRESLRLRQKLAADAPMKGEHRFDLAHSHYGLGDWHQARGDTAGALREYRLALELMKQVHADYPLVPDYRSMLSGLHRNVGAMMREQENHAGALVEYREAVRVFAKLVDDFPTIAEYRAGLARDRVALASVLVTQRELDAAAIEYQKARTAQESLVREFPSSASFRSDLANGLEGWGALDSARGLPDAAREKWNAALDLRAALVREFPNDPKLIDGLLRGHWRLAEEYAGHKDPDGALAHYRSAIAQAEKLVALRPEVAQYGISLFRLAFHAALLQADRRKLPEARAHYEQALRVAQELAVRHPGVPQRHIDVIGTHTNLALLLERMGEPHLAKQHQDEVVGRSDELLARFPDDVHVRVQWGGTQINRAAPLRAAGKTAQAVALLNPAIDRLEAAFKEAPRDRMARAFLRNGRQDRALCLDELNQPAKAAQDWERLWNLANNEADRVLFRSKTAQSLARAGDATRAVEIAESLAPVKQAPTIFARARIFALAFAHSKHDAHAARSVALLRTLLGMGLRDASRLKTDPDLAALRDRADFQKLVAEMEAASTPPPAGDPAPPAQW